MSPDRNAAARLESDRFRASGDTRTRVHDPAEEQGSAGGRSPLSQGSDSEQRGTGPKAPLDELLARAISSARGSSDAQQRILEKLGDLRTRFEEGLLRVAVIGQFKRGKSTLLNALLGFRAA